jgi:hypothetical protein
MYQCAPSFVLGFHGCDKKVGQDILHGKVIQDFSRNKYDWLGSGIYFWENDPDRAEEWANELFEKKIIEEPFVLGAVIDLKKCLNLLQSDALARLVPAYEHLEKTYSASEYKDFPKNKMVNGKGILVRNLDCAVIETLHELNNFIGEQPFDSVRGVFLEGDDLYPEAGFKRKNHIQICVRNRNCIKGYFLPRKKDSDLYPEPLTGL